MTLENNSTQSTKSQENWIEYIGISVIIILIWISRLYSFVLFHTIAELISVIIAGGIFVVGWNTRKYVKNSFFIILGVSAFAVSIIDTVHTLAYKGMNIFIGYDSNLSTSLWIAARFLQATSILLALFMIHKKIKPQYLLGLYSTLTSILLILIFERIFPVTYIEGVGLTPFKIVSEYVIVAILAICIVFLFKFKREFNKGIFLLILGFLIFTIVSEFLFTLYVGVYDTSNMVAHILKIIAFYLLYKAIVQIGLEDPLDVLFLQLNKSNEVLRREIVEKERAQQNLKNFVSTISHELRTPITVLKLSIDLLKKSKESEDLTMKDKLLYGVAKNTTLLNDLVEDLSIVLRIEDKHLDIEWKEYSPLSIVEEVLKSMESRQLAKNTKANIEIDEKIILYGDKKRIGQIFRILIDNALKYSSEGSTIKILSRDKYIGKYNPKKVDSVLFQVIDTGMGISEKDLPRIFERYYRTEDVKEIPGTGLGLSIAKELTHLHKGEISVESQVGKGSIFFVFLPRLKEKPL